MFTENRKNAIVRAALAAVLIAGIFGVHTAQAEVYDISVSKLIVAPQIHYVKRDATGANNGSTWGDAYTDLQSALSAALDGDQIWVAAGTYKPTTGADRTVSFRLKNGVALYGGFAGTETTLEGRNPLANVTTLSGDIGVAGDDSDNSYHVVVASVFDGTAIAILDGFTITDGNANGTDEYRAGGGMYIFGGNLTLTDVIFSNNHAGPNGRGGGLYNYAASPTLTNITFSGNTADYVGGGMFNSGNPILTNIIFSGNSSEIGGGLYNVGGGGGGNLTLTNATFSSNRATANYGPGRGGGMANSVGSPTLTNITFSGNTADNFGGGMYTTDGSPTLTNVTFSNNHTGPGGSGGGIHNYGEDLSPFQSNPILRNTILWANSASNGSQIDNLGGGILTISDSVVQDGYSGGTNIITTDPRLGALGDNGGFTPTMALLPGSSAVDAGNDEICPATDQRGVARPQDSHCDIGAFEAKLPVAATLVAPTGGILANRPVYAWNEVFDATWYYLWIGAVNNDGSVTKVYGKWYTANVVCRSGTCSITPETALPAGNYRWWIRTWNEVGFGPWSTNMDFTTSATGVTTLVYPAGDIGADYNPTYEWNEVPGASWYYLWVNGPNGNVIRNWYEASLICGGSTCSVTPDIELGGGAHQFWVQIWNEDGYGPWSPSVSFNVTPLGAATLVYPTGDIGTDYNPTYEWNEVTGATWYYLWVNGPSGNVFAKWYEASLICSTTTCSVTPTEVSLGGGAHRFWVQTWSESGYGPWSTAMSFNVAPLGAATLVSPDGSITETTPDYTWNLVTGATWYQLWVSRVNPNGSLTAIHNKWYAVTGDPALVCGASTCSATPQGVTLTSGNYRWWIQTWNAGGYGPWSSFKNFTVSP